MLFRSSPQRVAVIGASGYGGLQILRLLQDHPGFRVTFLGGSGSVGQHWNERTPFLPLPGNPAIEAPDPEAIAAAADLAVLSLPNGLASGLAPALLRAGVRVVDLSADYRFPSVAQWAATYTGEAVEHPRQEIGRAHV